MLIDVDAVSYAFHVTLAAGLLMPLLIRFRFHAIDILFCCH